MAFSRALLIKGLAGAAAVGAVGGGVGIAYRGDIGNFLNTLGKDKEGREEVNKRLENLGLGGDCLLKENEDPTNLPKECSLNLEQLKNIKFSNKGEGEVKVKYSGDFPSDLKLKIEGTKEDITFSFKGVTDSSPISIFGDKTKGKIVIKSEEQKFKDVDGRLTKSASVDETLKGFNEQLEKLNAPVECRFDEAETDASVECPVTEEDLKGMKFSGLGEGDLTIGGEVPQGLKLNVERNQENVMSLYFTELSQKLNIYVDQSGEKIVLKNGKKFRVGEDGKLEKVVVVVDSALKTQLGEFNKQLETIKAPTECRFDVEDGEESIECPVTQNELQKMVFSNKLGTTDLKIVGWPAGSKTIKLKAEKDSENEMSISFPEQITELNVFGRVDEGKIILRNDKKFKVVGGKLTKENQSAEIKELNKQLRNSGAPVECRFDEAEREESFECAVTQNQFKELGFSNKEGWDLIVNNWPTGTVKLKVEKDAQNAMSLSFPGLKASSSSPVTIYGKGGKIVIKSEEQKFTVIENKLTKESSNVDEDLKSKLKEFNEELGEVNAPLECRFDEMEREESVECDITPERLKTMGFLGGGWSGLTLSDEDFSGMKLKVQIVKTFGSGSNEDGKDLILTFKGYDKTVKVMDGNKEVVSFVKGTNPEFGIYGDDVEEEESSGLIVLSKRWDPDAFKNSLGLACIIDTGETEGNCIFLADSKEINVGKGTEDDFEKLTFDDTSGKSFELYKDVEDYNQGFKFVFTGETISGSSGSPSLVKEGKYEFRWKLKGNDRVGYLAKKDN